MTLAHFNPLLDADTRTRSADLRSVVVAALTFRRPATLETLLEGFSRLAVPPHCLVTFLIVDNDPSESARSTVEAWQSRIPTLRYVVESQPGIPVARNRALDEAGITGADALCFIDDDEQPDERWLQELVATWRAKAADLVGGPVRVALAPPGSSAWQRLINASVAGRARRKERDAAHDAARGRCRTIVTNNFLCDLRFANRHGLRFDETLLVTGGSDTDFFRRAVRAGGHAVWCPTAMVHETIEADRLSLRYQFRRGTFQSLNHFHMKQRKLTVPRVILTLVTAAGRAMLAQVTQFGSHFSIFECSFDRKC